MLFEMAFGKPPFFEKEISETYKRIANLDVSEIDGTKIGRRSGN